jgi:adenylate cyclase
VRFAPRALAAQLIGARRWLVALVIIGTFLLHPLTQFGKSSFLNKLEAIAYDTRLKFTLPPKQDDPQVVIVDIDEASLAKEGRWPWPRDKLARLTRQLFDRYQARAVGFDVLFAEADRSSGIDVLDTLAQGDLKADKLFAEALAARRPELDFDAQFADALRGKPVVLGFGFTDQAQEKGTLPPPLFVSQDLGHGKIKILAEIGYAANFAPLEEAAAGSGHFDPVFDADRVVRRVPMVKLYRGGYYPALSLALSRVVLEAKAVKPRFGPDNDLEAFDVGGLVIPVAEDGTALIPFRGPEKTFKYRSATEVLAGTAKVDFAGAVVLVGTTAKGLQDLRATPLAPDFPGVEIHANLISGMLNGDFKSVPPNADAVEALIMVVTGLILVFVIPFRRPLVNVLGVALIIAAVVGSNLWLWTRHDEAIPVAATLTMLVVLFGWNMLAGFMREERKIRRVSEMFGEYVPPQRVAQMVESGERYSMAGESRELTVLFCDVREFTALSENLTPQDLSSMMNAYLTPMTSLIHTYRGTVDKYIGDSIMAFWGAPVPNENHARDGVDAALAMQERIPALTREFTSRGWPALAIGIGINSGTMNVGDMGSEFRKAYTVLGDAVNLASRFEGLTKEYGVPVIIGEDTRRVIPEMICRELDRVRVKGRAHAVTIYQPLGRTLGNDLGDELGEWDAALAEYRGHKFAEAEASFAALASAHAAQKLYALYRARCVAFRNQPPAPDWDGTTTFVAK